MSGFLRTDLPMHRPGNLQGACRYSGAVYPLLIEIAGPAATGKSTVARALAAELAASGHPVTVVSSARPSEQEPDSRRPSALAAALSRASKVLDLTRQQDGAVARQLLDFMPPRHRLWSLRYRRYLAELERAWTAARATSRVVIFDQAYLSALIALFTLGRDPSPQAFARSLDVVPSADLNVSLSAPLKDRERRLDTRLGRQGALERLFELDLPTTLRQSAASRTLEMLLEARGTPPIRVENREGVSVEILARSIAAAIDTVQPSAAVG